MFSLISIVSVNAFGLGSFLNPQELFTIQDLGSYCEDNWACRSDQCDENMNVCVECDQDSDCRGNNICVAGLGGAFSNHHYRECVPGVRCDTYRDCNTGEGCSWDISQGGDYNPYCKHLANGVDCMIQHRYTNCPPTYYCAMESPRAWGSCQPRLDLNQSCQSDDQCSSQYCDAGSCQTSATNCAPQDVYWSLGPADGDPITEAFVGQRVYLNAELPTSCDVSRVTLRVRGGYEQF